MLLDQNGTRLDRASLPVTAVTDPNPLFAVTADLYTRRAYDISDGTPQSTARISTRLFAKAGTTVRKAALDAVYDLASVTTVVPATGAAAGGTVVTLNGKYLDGAHGVTFGGTAGTAFVASADGTSITVTAPAHVAGAVALVVADDSGNTTLAAAYLYV